MKNFLLGFAGLVLLTAAAPLAHAQMMGNYGSGYGMMGDGYPDAQTQAAPADSADELTTASSTDNNKGAVLWQQLQNKQVTCSELTNEDFDALGDYFMGAMMGNTDEQMDQWMTARWGEQNTEQMHIVMGQRLSGCDPSAAYPGYGNYFPMMGMMGAYGYGMGPGYGYGGSS